MTSILRTYHAHKGNYTPGGNNPKWIIVHYTANTASALNEAIYANNDQHASSYHFVLDGLGIVYQVLDLTDTAWAVGAWAGATQLIRNDESVSIEVCNDGGPFTTDQIADLRWLVRRLMGELGIDADHVVRHFDAHTGRKECPRFYAGFHNRNWEALHDTITREELMKPQDVWNCDLAYQEVKTGKQVNRPAWNIVSWTGHNVEYMLPKVNDTASRVISLETKVTELRNRVITLETAQKEQTTLMKNMQKALNTIVKKLA